VSSIKGEIVRLHCLRLQFKYIAYLCSLSVVLIGGDYHDITVEDFYGEWQLDEALRVGSSVYSHDDIIEYHGGHILIGPGIDVTGSYFNDGFTWTVDISSVNDDGMPFPDISSEFYVIYGKITARLRSIYRVKWDAYQYYMLRDNRIATSVDNWILFYKKTVSEKQTDFENPYLKKLYGRWEPSSITRFSLPLYKYEEIDTLFSTPIDFTKYGYFDHKKEYNLVDYQMDSSSRPDSFKYCFRHLPDSSRTNIGVVTQFTLFSDEGYILNRFELSESGILCDYFDGWFIFYEKQPPPPLKKQGAQP